MGNDRVNARGSGSGSVKEAAGRELSIPTQPRSVYIKKTLPPVDLHAGSQQRHAAWRWIARFRQLQLLNACAKSALDHHVTAQASVHIT